MRLESRLLELFRTLLAVVALSACGDDDAATTSSAGPSGGPTSTGAGGSGSGSSGSSEGVGAGTQGIPPTSPTALLKFRTGRRLEADVAKALGLESSEVCNELGLYDCVGVHQVPLLEPDAFGAGLYQPLPEPTATTPLAAERVVLSACDRAVRRDLDGEGGVIWAKLEIDTSGALVDPDDDSVEEAITTLVHRALLREPEAWEIEAHRDFYDEIAAASATESPAREWATLGCFATLTSLEFLFY